MAESIGTTALIITADTAGLTSGLRQAKGQYQGFVGDTQRTGQELSASFTSARDKIGEIFNNVKAGKFGDAFLGVKAIAADVTSAVSGIGGAATSTLVSLSALAAAGGIIAGIGFAARATTKDLNDLNKLSQRIGSSTQDTQVILRSFGRAGIEDAEASLQKFFDKLGDVRRDAQGPTAQAFRRLQLDPNALLRQSPIETIRQTIEALSRVTNVYDRASISQAIFGKTFQEVQELIRQGRGAFERAGRFVELTGDSDATIQTAVRAEARWREVGDTVSTVWGVVRRVGRAALTDISDDLSKIARQVATLDFPNAGQLGDFLVPGSSLARPGQPLSQREQEEQRRRRQQQAEALGSVGNFVTPGGRLAQQASIAAIDAARPEAIEARARRSREIWEDLVLRDPVFVDVRFRFPDIRPAIQGAVAAARAAGLLGDQLVANRNLRPDAEAAGLLPPGAIQSELDALRPLLDMRRQLRLAPGASVTLPVFDFVARMVAAEQSQRRINDLTTQWNREAENVGRTQLEIDLALIDRERRLGRISDLEAEIARGARLDLEQQRGQQRERDRQRDEARQVIDRNRTPLEQFREENAKNAANPNLTAQQRDRDAATRFSRLLDSLGSGPSSFAVTAPTFGSIEGARFLADSQIRQRNGVDDPQRQVARGMDALRRVEEMNGTRLDRIADAIRGQPRTAPAPPI